MLTWQNISQSFRLIHMTQTTADNTQWMDAILT
jgi:hypothetical protein